MSLQLARAPRPLSVRPATRGAGVLLPALHDGSWMGTGRSNERKLPNGHRKGALDAELSMEANLSASTDRLMPYRRPSACPNCPLFPWLVVSSSNYFILYFCCREMKECYKSVVDAGKKL